MTKKKYTEEEVKKREMEWYEKGVEEGKYQLLRSLHELLRTDDLLDRHEENYHTWQDQEI